MAFEVDNWKQEGCSLSLITSRVTQRETFSKEINQTFGEGGGLNANYRDVEAVAKVSNLLGNNGLVYGRHFVFKTAGVNEFKLDFSDSIAKGQAEKILSQSKLI